MDVAETIRKKREELNLSQAKLGELAGTNQQTIDRIENGSHSRAIPRVLQVLDLAPGAESAQATRIIPQATQRLHGGDLPVYASARGGPGEILFSMDPIDYVGRPDPLANVRDGYAMWIVGDSMSPAFEQGDLALVNPHRPFRPGDDVLIYREWENELAAVVKRLIRAANDEWQLEQFNPGKRFKLSRKEWPRCHVIVGKYSRR